MYVCIYVIVECIYSIMQFYIYIQNYKLDKLELHPQRTITAWEFSLVFLNAMSGVDHEARMSGEYAGHVRPLFSWMPSCNPT